MHDSRREDGTRLGLASGWWMVPRRLGGVVAIGVGVVVAGCNVCAQSEAGPSNAGGTVGGAGPRLIRWWPEPWSAREELTGQEGGVMGILPAEAAEGSTELLAMGSRTGWVQLEPPLPAGPFTLALWVHPEGKPEFVFMEQRDESGRWQVLHLAGQHPGDVYWIATDHSDASEAAEWFRIPAGAWHHVAIAGRPDQTMTVWVDGRRVVEGRVQHRWPAAARGLSLGNSEKGDLPWHGRVRDLRVYDAPLSDDAVAALHRAGLPPMRRAVSDAFRAAIEISASRSGGSPEPILFVAEASESPAVVHRRYTTEDGLPSNLVQAVVPSASGHLWVGTDLGLARFDGRQFRVFDANNTPALAETGPDISSLAEAPDGTVWAGAYGGLVRIRGTEMTAFTRGLPERFVLLATPAEGDTVWVAGFRLDPAYRGPCRVRRFDPEHGLSLAEAVVPGQVRRMEPGPGGLWLMTEEPYGVYFWTGRSADLVRQVAAVLPEAPFVRVAGAPHSGDAPKVRLGVRPGEARHWVEVRAGGIEPPFRFLIGGDPFPVRPGRWAGPAGTEDWVGAVNGLCRLTSRGAEECRFEGDALPPVVLCLAAHRDGGIWLGTREDGLHFVRRRPVEVFTSRDGLPADSIQCVAVDPGGVVWAGTDAGVARGPFPGGRQYPGLRTRTLALGAGGEPILGLSGSGGLEVRFDFAMPPPAMVSELEWSHPNSLVRSKEGALWVTCGHGITWISGPALEAMKAGGEAAQWSHLANPWWRRWRTGVELGVEPPLGLVEDSEGALWAGSMGSGLYRVTRGTLEVLTRAHGLPSDGCLPVYAENHGGVWVATDRGLALHRGGKFSVLREEDGLPEVGINGMLEDDLGSFWLVGRHGIHRLRRVDVNAFFAGALPRVNSFTLSMADGFPTPGGASDTRPVIAKGPDGRLWLATPRGLVVLDPRALGDEQSRLPLFVESVRANRREVPVPGPLPGAQSSRPEPELTLEAGSGKRLEFECSAVSLTEAHRIRFRYRLDGHDSGWSPETDLRLAFYTNLRPGRYVFRAQAAYANAPQTRIEVALPFQIQAHFWETGSFRVVLGLSAVGIVVGAHRRRVVHLRRMEAWKRQEALASERARIAADLHDDLGAALTQVTVLAQLAQTRTPREAPAMPALERVTEVARGITSRISDLVWATNPQDSSLDHLVAHLREQVGRQLEAFSGEVHLAFAEEVPQHDLTATFRRNVLFVVKEVVTNALKHAHASRIAVEVAVREGRLLARISDDGKGFDAEHCSGVGHGLGNLRRRVSDLGGQIEITSAQGHGTRVAMEVPLSSGDLAG